MLNVLQYLPHLRRQEGDVGVEIEVEGDSLPTMVKDWRIEGDGSLRGEALEYVLPKPLTVNGVKMALKRLEMAFEANKAKVLDSGYAGIHIHVNVQQLTVTQLCTFAFLYYCIEDLCLDFCGEDRKGNLFCLSAGVAPYPLKALQEALERGDLNILKQDKLRYASLNWKALAEYGSLEFRGMRSTLDRGIIMSWVELLLELRTKAIEIDNPQRVVELYSELRGDAFVKFILPTQHETLKGYNGDVNRAIERGVRSIQSTVYLTDWGKWIEGKKPLKDVEFGDEARARIRDMLQAEAAMRVPPRPLFFVHPQPEVWIDDVVENNGNEPLEDI